MANHCFNKISFFGNDKVIAQVRQWRKQIGEIKPTKEDPYCMRAIGEVLYPEQDPADIEYGSKWVHPDDDSTGASNIQLGLQSAWYPPDDLLKHLACVLYKLDPKVIVEDLFYVEDGSFGFRYVAPTGQSSVYEQSFDCPVNYDDFDEREDAEAEAEVLCLEVKREYLTDLISDIPDRFDVVQKFIPDLVEDWDELKREIDDNASEDGNYVEGSSGLEQFLKLKGH